MTQVAHNVFKGAQCEFKKEIWLVAMKWTDDSNCTKIEQQYNL